MNRIIKYRVWDTRQNKYLHPDTVSISGSGIMSFAGTGGKYHTITQPSDDPSPRFIIEQDTGLKDKNGNAIYEGDIVNMHFFEQYLGLNGGVGEKDGEVVGVIGVDGIGTFIKANNKKYYLLNYLEDAEYCADAKFNEELEVVGNIHQNPELLEGE